MKDFLRLLAKGRNRKQNVRYVIININNVNYFTSSDNLEYGEIHFNNGEVIKTLESIDYFQNVFCENTVQTIPTRK